MPPESYAALPTQRELQALRILWRTGGSTVREIHEAMTSEQEELAYTTVLSLMQTMETKGLVGHTASGKTYTYFSKAKEQVTLASLARGFVDSVFGGALDQFVLHAARGQTLTHDEIARLEQLVREAKGGKQKPLPKKRGGAS